MADQAKTRQDGDTWFDFTFADIPHEVMLLREYVELLESHLPALVEAEKNRIWAAAANDTHGESSYVARHLAGLLEDGITTRFLTGSAFIAIWASYEAAALRFAAQIAKRKASEPMPRDRKSFVRRARKYFGEHFPLHASSEDWDKLEQLAKVRHAIAHANGRLEDVKPETAKLLRKLADPGRGLYVVDDTLVLALPFVRESLDFVERLLTDLRERVEAI